MAFVTHPRLENLLAVFSLNLTDKAMAALQRVSGLTGCATASLLALEQFLDETHVGRLADALGLTHSGAVRLVSQLEAAGEAGRGSYNRPCRRPQGGKIDGLVVPDM